MSVLKRGRRGVEQVSLSFLDCICCGFGAIILLLVLAKTAEPMRLEQTQEDLSGLVAQLQETLFEIRGETEILNRTLVSKQEQLSQIKDKIARLNRLMETIKSEFDVAGPQPDAVAKLENQLKRAQQELNEAQARMSFRRAVSDTTVGGIPIDSEYVIFVIDTSGSMYNYAWQLLLDKVIETLEVYPEVKGIQVMNDMGQYMFSRYSGTWIPDSPGRRRAIVERMRTWNAFSNSSPVEGINKAIRTFYQPDKKISVYVFGDDFSGGSVEQVLATIDTINKETKEGERMVRIHAVGFPVHFLAPPNMQRSVERFANLMRLMTERNGGTFVGLNSHRP